MSTVELASRRRMSSALFGNSHRLELLLALAQAGEAGVNLSELGVAQGVAPSVYYGPIRDLITLGLVDKLGRVRGDRRCWYRRRGQAVWSSVESLVDELAEVEVRAS